MHLRCVSLVYIFINDNNRNTQKLFEQAQKCGWVKPRLKQWKKPAYICSGKRGVEYS